MQPILDELVELAVGRPEVHVAVGVVFRGLVDVDPRGTKLGDRVSQDFDLEAHGANRVTHAAWIGY